MAFGIAEDLGRSPGAQLDEVDFPVWRETLIRIVEDNEASVDAINLFKSLPRNRYESKQEVLRDFAEAARRFGTGNFAAEDAGTLRDRRNLGRDAVENAPEGRVRHP